MDEFTWITRAVRNQDGDKLTNHLMVDLTGRVLASVRERDGLFHTDLRFDGTDRTYLDLTVAKAYCEAMWETVHGKELAWVESQQLFLQEARAEQLNAPARVKRASANTKPPLPQTPPA